MNITKMFNQILEIEENDPKKAFILAKAVLEYEIMGEYKPIEDIYIRCLMEDEVKEDKGESNFIFRKVFQDTMNTIKDGETKDKLFKAIVDYGIYGREDIYNEEPWIKTVMVPIKKIIEEDKEKIRWKEDCGKSI